MARGIFDPIRDKGGKSCSHQEGQRTSRAIRTDGPCGVPGTRRRESAREVKGRRNFRAKEVEGRGTQGNSVGGSIGEVECNDPEKSL